MIIYTVQTKIGNVYREFDGDGKYSAAIGFAKLFVNNDVWVNKVVVDSDGNRYIKETIWSNKKEE